MKTPQWDASLKKPVGRRPGGYLHGKFAFWRGRTHHGVSELRVRACPAAALMTVTPKSLLERLRQGGDEQSWSRLVGIYVPWLDLLLRRADIAPDDVPDLRQEVLATVVREMPHFEHSGQTGAFRTWMRNIVLNRLRGYWRSRAAIRRRFTEEGSLQDVANRESELEQLWDTEHDRHVVQQILTNVEPLFSAGTWLAFRRQVLEGRSPRAVAEELNISVNAALLAKSRVLKRLREEAKGMVEDA